MFGNKDKKQSRLEKIAALVRNATAGISQADLARKVGVTRATISKDMGIVEKMTGSLFYEDDGFVYPFDDGEGYDD